VSVFVADSRCRAGEDLALALHLGLVVELSIARLAGHDQIVVTRQAGDLLLDVQQELGHGTRPLGPEHR